jgi:hypothetical protein
MSMGFTMPLMPGSVGSSLIVEPIAERMAAMPTRGPEVLLALFELFRETMRSCAWACADKANAAQAQKSV